MDSYSDLKYNMHDHGIGLYNKEVTESISFRDIHQFQDFQKRGFNLIYGYICDEMLLKVFKTVESPFALSSLSQHKCKNRYGL